MKRTAMKFLHFCLIFVLGLHPLSAAPDSPADAASQGPSDSASKNPHGLANNKQTDLDLKVKAWMAEYKVPAVGIGVIENGIVTTERVYGELKEGSPAPTDTIFNIASMTKPVVAMMTLKLVQQGRWDLDEPLFHYWIDPDVANNPFHEKLTTRHVLTHQTGFLNWRRQDQDNKLSFKFEPGKSYQYSGEGFVYLTRALENKFGKSLAELAESLIFQPLRMKDSRLYWDKDMDESRFAYWHDSNGRMHTPATSQKRKVNAAGSMLTTIEDFCKFGIYVMDGMSLSSSLYAEITESYVPLGKRHHRGLGWEVVTGLPNEEVALQHGGADQGVQTIAVFLPKSKRGLVIFTNGDNGKLISNNIIKECLDVGPAIFENTSGTSDYPVLHLTNEALLKFAGIYLDTYGRELTVIIDENNLKMSGKGIPTVILYPMAKDKFFMKDVDVKFEFVTSDHLIVTANGKVDCTAKRIK